MYISIYQGSHKVGKSGNKIMVGEKSGNFIIRPKVREKSGNFFSECRDFYKLFNRTRIYGNIDSSKERESTVWFSSIEPAHNELLLDPG